MVSASMESKLAKMRDLAAYELPKVRACALVVLAQAEPASPRADAALAALRAVAGPSWGIGTAVQYLAGRQAQLTIAIAPEVDKAQLLLAQALALRVHHDAPNGEQAGARLMALMQAARA